MDYPFHAEPVLGSPTGLIGGLTPDPGRPEKNLSRKTNFGL
jgi:hypothetical protein